ncbi:TPA: hypothetical protein ACPTZX_005296 [Escherichia coli]
MGLSRPIGSDALRYSSQCCGGSAPAGDTAQASLPQPAPSILSIWVRLVGLRRKNPD